MHAPSGGLSKYSSQNPLPPSLLEYYLSINFWPIFFKKNNQGNSKNNFLCTQCNSSTVKPLEVIWSGFFLYSFSGSNQNSGIKARGHGGKRLFCLSHIISEPMQSSPSDSLPNSETILCYGLSHQLLVWRSVSGTVVELLFVWCSAFEMLLRSFGH